MKFLVVVSVVLGVAAAAVPSVRRDSTPDDFELPSNATLIAAVSRVRRDSTPDNYELPSNASVVVGGINYGFDCAGRNFGYYADLNNNCQIFHICMPYEDAEGVPQMRMWSFLCGVGTIFDQAQLVCNYPEDSLPCAQAESSYNINDYFHREDLEFRGGEANRLA
ncbi:U-scoloptoxin(01)-Er1a isoform X1 [Hyalella azteca]|uniref:U-scoloptoxin(01)-Er1a isoform X1 n=1 Tax=Hyalella azteca TaxID=294128 RepID=A0A8B7N5N9_HYAAZ|nr:U-scoloptoxin(01)-Er1a isoform X1 [Hyalella azteca]